MLHDIQTLFAAEPCIKGFSPGPKALRSADTLEKGHGRIERRTLTARRDLKGDGEWPYAEQVFQLEREFKPLNTGQLTQDGVYGVSRLTAPEADAARLLAIMRGHWGIESGLHDRRDVTLREDRSRVRTGQAPQLLAAINNLVLGVVARLGYTSAPEARRHFASAVGGGGQTVDKNLF